MATKAELLREARRCAYNASRGVTPGNRQMVSGLARFYDSLAQSETEEPAVEPELPVRRGKVRQPRHP